MEKKDLNRRLYLEEKIKNWLEKKPDLTLNQIERLFEKLQMRKIPTKYFPSPKEIQEILDFFEIDHMIENELSKSKPKPQKSTSNSQVKLPEIICPHCGLIQKWRYRGGKYKHTYCKNPTCKKHIIIKPDEQTQLQQLNPHKPISSLKLKLSNTDEKIIAAFDSNQGPLNLTQKQLSEKINRHLSTVCRHVRNLVQLEILDEIDLGIKVYQLNTEYLKSITDYIPIEKKDDEKENFITIHHIMSKIPILNETGLHINLATIQQIPEVQDIRIQPMQNWMKYKFTYQFLEVDINASKNGSITFNTIGAGQHSNPVKASDKAFENLHEKTEWLKSYFEQKLPVQLGKPEYKEIRSKVHAGTHFVNHRGTPEEIQIFKEVFSDKSHPGTIETTNEAFANSMTEVHLRVQELTEQMHILQNQQSITPLHSLDEKIAQIETGMDQRIGRIETNVSKMATSMEQLVSVLTSLTNPQPLTLKPTTTSYI